MAACTAFGQKATQSASASIAAGSNQGSLNLAWLHRRGLGKNGKFGIGLGVRFTSYIAQNQYYTTAPAQLTTGSTGPGVIFKPDIDANIDTLLVKSPQVNALNLFINMDYRLTQKLQLGFNIDAIGFSFGARTQANYINGASGKITEATPTSFNLLLVSDNDQGSLNSEFYLNYLISEKWGIRAGAQFLFTEYTTDTNVQTFPEENDRFRKKSLLPSLGITYLLKP